MSFLDVDERRRLRLTLLACLAWLLLAELAVPLLLERLYESDALSWIEGVQRTREEEDLDYVLDRWHGASRWVVPPVLLWLAVAIAGRRPTYVRRHVGRITASHLGMIRALVCGLLALLTLSQDLAGTAQLPESMIRSSGLLEPLYRLPLGLDVLSASPVALGGPRAPGARRRWRARRYRDWSCPESWRARP